MIKCDQCGQPAIVHFKSKWLCPQHIKEALSSLPVKRDLSSRTTRGERDDLGDSNL